MYVYKTLSRDWLLLVIFLLLLFLKIYLPLLIARVVKRGSLMAPNQSITNSLTLKNFDSLLLFTSFFLLSFKCDHFIQLPNYYSNAEVRISLSKWFLKPIDFQVLLLFPSFSFIRYFFVSAMYCKTYKKILSIKLNV